MIIISISNTSVGNLHFNKNTRHSSEIEQQNEKMVAIHAQGNEWNLKVPTPNVLLDEVYLPCTDIF